MKALLICPALRPEVAALGRRTALAVVPVLGNNLVACWLEHLAALGAREVLVLATERPEEVRAFVGSGARWGLRAEVLPELRELTPVEARRKYQARDRAAWLASPNDVVLADQLPNLPQHRILSSYRAWFEGVVAAMQQPAPPSRVGMREVQPAVWVSTRARLARTARLQAPCWVGHEACVRSRAIIGPRAVIEDRALIEPDCEVSDSVVGPETMMGPLTEVRDSLACGSLLINWRLGSVTNVPDRFLMRPLKPVRSLSKSPSLLGRSVAAGLMALTVPVAAAAVLRAKLCGRPAFRSLVAVRPGLLEGVEPETFIYYELAEVAGWFRLWPQLWNVARGDFAWVGNRPLSPAEASTLTTDFEQLWLAAPTGLISYGDAQGCTDLASEEARAHATYYAVRAGWRLDLEILIRLLRRSFWWSHRGAEAP